MFLTAIESAGKSIEGAGKSKIISSDPLAIRTFSCWQSLGFYLFNVSFPFSCEELYVNLLTDIRSIHNCFILAPQTSYIIHTQSDSQSSVFRQQCHLRKERIENRPCSTFSSASVLMELVGGSFSHVGVVSSFGIAHQSTLI